MTGSVAIAHSMRVGSWLGGPLKAAHHVLPFATVALIWGATHAAAAQESESYLEPEPTTASEDGSEAKNEEAPTASEPDVPKLLRGLRVHAGALLGAGGSADFDPDADSEPMATTFGLQCGADYLLTRLSPHLAIGAELRLGWWTVDYWKDSGEDRSKWLDLSIKPRARYPFGETLEVYGVLPIGPSYVMPADGTDQSSSLGFNIGIGPGATLMVNEVLGVNLELLYLWRWYRVESSQAYASDGTEMLSQLTFFANFVVQL